MSDLSELSRADLVQVAKDEGVKASGRSEDIIERIEAKRAEGPASSSVDGASDAPEGAAPTVVINTVDPTDPELLRAIGEAATAERAPAAQIGDALPIRRETDAAWWCPICDNSQTHTLQECGGCGAGRDGDEVVA